jgi:RHS repeat-associated protein
MIKTYSTLGYLQNTQVKNGSALKWDMGYGFDPTTGNLSSGSDNLQSQSETFSYDNPRDRLTDIYLNGSASPTNSTTYYPAGNIGSKTDVGSYDYAGAQPHAVSAIENPTPNVPTVQQTINYTPFNKADNIAEGPYSLQFTYGPDNARKMSVLTNTVTSAVERTVISVGDYEKITKGSNTYEVHYINTPDGLAAIDVRHNGSTTDQMNYIYTDHLGSINLIYDQNKNKVYEQSFDAWGRERDPQTWAPLPSGGGGGGLPDWLIRGYTGHEHHKEFGLINMNGRMYDPLLGRMLSPDNNVSAPDFTESYNKYSYVMNNPMKYTDPSGMKNTIGGGSLAGGDLGTGFNFRWGSELNWGFGGGDASSDWGWGSGGGGGGGGGGSMDQQMDAYWNSQTLYATAEANYNAHWNSWQEPIKYDVNIGGTRIQTFSSQKEAEAFANQLMDAQTNLYASLNGGSDLKLGFDIEKAVDYLNAHAGSASQGACSRFVQAALVAGGIDATNPVLAGRKYGPLLEKWGFDKVSSTDYTPIKGDVAVIQGYPGGRADAEGIPYGHIQMYNGNQWVSDFFQPTTRNFYPGPQYELYKPSYAIYRW